jgi:hypothetical protein
MLSKSLTILEGLIENLNIQNESFISLNVSNLPLPTGLFSSAVVARFFKGGTFESFKL